MGGQGVAEQTACKHGPQLPKFLLAHGRLSPGEFDAHAIVDETRTAGNNHTYNCCCCCVVLLFGAVCVVVHLQITYDAHGMYLSTGAVKCENIIQHRVALFLTIKGPAPCQCCCGCRLNASAPPPSALKPKKGSPLRLKPTLAGWKQVPTHSELCSVALTVFGLCLHNNNNNRPVLW